MYHPALLQQRRARDGIIPTTQYRPNLRYTHLHYIGIVCELQPKDRRVWAADLSRLIDHGVEVWTHTLHPVSGFSQGLPIARAAVRQPGEKSEFGRLRFISCTAVFLLQENCAPDDLYDKTMYGFGRCYEAWKKCVRGKLRKTEVI